MRQKGFVLIPVIIIVLVSLVGYLVYNNIQLRTNNNSISPFLSPIPSSTFTPIQTSTPTSTVAPTPEPSPMVDEIGKFRHVLAEFEKYIAVSNTAGALQFFTPPISNEARAKLESIRSVDLPFRLTFWSFYSNDDSYLLSNKIQNGYKMTMIEGRAGVTTYLVIELVRVDDGFLIDRYYHIGVIERGNREDLKYEGFGL